jgi:signal transduction histidine kinase
MRWSGSWAASPIVPYAPSLSSSPYPMMAAMGDAAQEPLHRIARSARYLLSLVDGTVDLARDRIGDLTPRIELVPLHETIHEAMKTFRTHAEERALPHAVHVDSELPPVRSDPERLARALDLLLLSAVKHPDGRGVEIHVQRDPDGATIRVRGVRIPTHPDAGDPALRTGIRIAIVAATARLLGGDLRLEHGPAHAATGLILRIRDTPPFDDPVVGS